MAEQTRELADHLESIGSGALLVLTGAGISAASGLPTFRGDDPGAIWARDVTELATRAFFERQPVDSWQWYLARFDMLQDAVPNRAHEALVDLESWHQGRGGDFLLVTQNIDTLHEDAGSRGHVKVHGSIDRVRCSTDGCRHGAPTGSLPRDDFDLTMFARAPSTQNLPRCPACQAIMRPHVLWFDEYYAEHDDYEVDRVQSFVARMDCVLIVGTSLSVGITELVVGAALGRRLPALYVEPATHSEAGGLHRFAARAEELLPAVVDHLGAARG